MTAHVAETNLALYVSGDVSLWRSALVSLHVAQCSRCRNRADAYRSDRTQIQGSPRKCLSAWKANRIGTGWRWK